jgi:hypothetical protein
MSLSRNNSSTDEFYDAFETIDEIPSSSREDSTCITENDSGVVKNGSSLRSIEEDEEVGIENAIAKNVNSESRENDDRKKTERMTNEEKFRVLTIQPYA